MMFILDRIAIKVIIKLEYAKNKNKKTQKIGKSIICHKKHDNDKNKLYQIAQNRFAKKIASNSTIQCIFNLGENKTKY